MNITSGKRNEPRRIVFYGVEGIGKSTIASRFPEPLFIDTEGSTNDMDVMRFDPPASSWQMLLDQIKYVRDNPSVCKTLVIDTIDWAEKIEIEDLCKERQWKGLEDAGYGKGYTYSAERIGLMLNLLKEVNERGIHIVITAHAQLQKVELPEEMGAYDHWTMKTSKKAAPLVKEWATDVFFCNYKTHVIEVENKKKAQGNERVMYTTHTPHWDAKNRLGLPDMVPFKYASIKDSIEGTAPVKKEEPKPEPKIEKPKPVAEKPVEKPVDKPKNLQELKEEAPFTPDVDKRVPKALRDLMIKDHVSEWDIQNICEAKGYVPQGTPVYEYETVAPGFINGALVGHWESVVKQITQMNEKQEVPFA